MQFFILCGINHLAASFGIVLSLCLCIFYCNVNLLWIIAVCVTYKKSILNVLLWAAFQESNKYLSVMQSSASKMFWIQSKNTYLPQEALALMFDHFLWNDHYPDLELIDFIPYDFKNVSIQNWITGILCLTGIPCLLNMLYSNDGMYSLV